jgi:putative ABC transport system permease protein
MEPSRNSAGNADRLSLRCYRRCLRALLPAELEPGAEEMAQTYADLAAAASRTGGAGAELRVLGGAVAGLVRCAAAENMERRRAEREAARRVAAWRRARSRQGAVAMWTRDVGHAVRSLRRRRGFALGVMLLVGLGVGTVTAVFSVVDAVLLRALPYPEAERLVYFGHPAHSGPKLRDWRERLDTVEGVAGAWVEPVALTGVGAPVRVREARVTDGLFELFGASAAQGRLLAPGDFVPAGRVAVLGHELWQSQFGGDPDIVGRSIAIEGEPHDVVGVIDRRFRPPEALTGDRVDLWVPLDLAAPMFAQRNIHVLQVAGRLAPAVGVDAARAEVDALTAALAAEFPESEARRDGSVPEQPLSSLHEATTGGVGRTLYLLLAAVSAMLLIACANVAALALARANGRERELSLRSALGASRRQVGSLLLAESLLLALLGGVLGVALAALALRAFRLFAPSDIPRFGEVAIDWRVVVFALALSVLTGLLFGVVPALRSARAHLAASLREQGSGPGRRKQRLRAALVVMQVALALALSVGSGLLFHSFLRLRAVELGFDPARVTRVALQLGRLQEGEAGEQRRRQFADALLERISALPGVDSAALGWSLPFDFVGGSRCCWRTGLADAARPPENERDAEAAMIHPVSSDYFRVLGVPLLEGRGLEDADGDQESLAVVLGRELAERLFPDGGAVGATVVDGRGSLRLRVVGVVADFRTWGLDQEIESGAFVSYRSFGGRAPLLSLAVRSELPLETLSESLRRAIWDLDPDLPIESITELEQRIAGSIAVPRFYSTLLLVFAALALGLAAAGIYGSLLYAVGQRVREMGVRLALGAARGDVVRLVVAQGFAQVAIGIALGLGLVIAGGRLLEGTLFGITSSDPWSLAAASAVLSGVALLACWLPARRAAATDPVKTLRAE